MVLKFKFFYLSNHRRQQVTQKRCELFPGLDEYDYDDEETHILNCRSEDRVKYTLTSEEIPAVENINFREFLDYVQFKSTAHNGQDWYECINLISQPNPAGDALVIQPKMRKKPIYGWPSGKTYRIGSMGDWEVFLDFTDGNQQRDSALPASIISHIDWIFACALQMIRYENYQISGFFCHPEKDNFPDLGPIELFPSMMNVFFEMFREKAAEAFNGTTVENSVFFMDHQASLVIQRFGQNQEIVDGQHLEDIISRRVCIKSEYLGWVEFSKALNIMAAEELEEAKALIFKKECVRRLCVGGGNSNETVLFPQFFRTDVVNLQHYSGPTQTYISGNNNTPFSMRAINTSNLRGRFEVLSYQIYMGCKSTLRPSKEKSPAYSGKITGLLRSKRTSDATVQELKKELRFNGVLDGLRDCAQVPSPLRIEFKVRISEFQNSFDGLDSDLEKWTRVKEDIRSAWQTMRYYHSSEDGNLYILGLPANTVIKSVKSKTLFEYAAKVFEHLRAPLESIVNFRASEMYTTPSQLQVAAIMERLIRFFFTGKETVILKCMGDANTGMGLVETIRKFGLPYISTHWCNINMQRINFHNFCVLNRKWELPADAKLSAIEREFMQKHNQVCAFAHACKNGNAENGTLALCVEDLVQLALKELEHDLDVRAGPKLKGTDTFLHDIVQQAWATRTEFVFQNNTVMRELLRLGASRLQQTKTVEALVSILFPTERGAGRLQTFGFRSAWDFIKNLEWRDITIVTIQGKLTEVLNTYQLNWLVNVFNSRMPYNRLVVISNSRPAPPERIMAAAHQPAPTQRIHNFFGNAGRNIAMPGRDVEIGNREMGTRENPARHNIVMPLPPTALARQPPFGRSMVINVHHELRRVVDFEILCAEMLAHRGNIVQDPYRYGVNTEYVNCEDAGYLKAVICALLHASEMKYNKGGDPPSMAALFLVVYAGFRQGINCRSMLNGTELRTFDRLKAGQKHLETYGLVESIGKDRNNFQIVSVLPVNEKVAELKEMVQTLSVEELKRVMKLRVYRTPRQNYPAY
jgi:hypothetical protein